MYFHFSTLLHWNISFDYRCYSMLFSCFRVFQPTDLYRMDKNMMTWYKALSAEKNHIVIFWFNAIIFIFISFVLTSFINKLVIRYQSGAANTYTYAVFDSYDRMILTVIAWMLLKVLLKQIFLSLSSIIYIYKLNLKGSDV